MLQKPNSVAARLNIIFYTVIVFAFIASVIAIFVFVGFTVEYGAIKIEQQLWVFPRIHGFMGEPTSLGALLGYALLLYWHLNQAQRKSYLLTMVALVIGIGLIWSGSRNAIISLAISIMYYQIATGKFRVRADVIKKVIFILPIILLLALLFIFGWPEISQVLVNAIDRKDTAIDNENNRYLIWGKIFALLGESKIQEIIIGHGGGALRDTYRAAFNSPLEIMFDYGFVGLIIFLSWALVMMVGLFNHARLGNSSMSALAGTFVVYGFVFNLFVSWFPTPHFNFSLFSLVMGAALIFYSKSKLKD